MIPFIPVCCCACGRRIGACHILEGNIDFYCQWCLEDFARFVEQFSQVGNNFTGQLLLCIYQIVSRDFKSQYDLNLEISQESSNTLIIDKLTAAE